MDGEAKNIDQVSDKNSAQQPVPADEEQKADCPDDLLLEAAQDLNDEQLNVTADEKDKDDDAGDEDLNKEYEALMKGFQQMSENIGGAEGVDKIFGDLLKGIGAEGDGAGEEGEGGKARDDQFIENLIRDMMDKELLGAPLLEFKASYEQFFARQAQNPTWEPENEQNFRAQYKCITEILEIMEKDPNNKDAMVKKFEEMMELGNPPEEIVKNGADGQATQNPFQIFQTLQQEGAGADPAQQLPKLFEKLLMPGQPQQQPGNGDNADEQCCIF